MWSREVGSRLQTGRDSRHLHPPPGGRISRLLHRVPQDQPTNQEFESQQAGPVVYQEVSQGFCHNCCGFRRLHSSCVYSGHSSIASCVHTHLLDRIPGWYDRVHPVRYKCDLLRALQSKISHGNQEVVLRYFSNLITFRGFNRQLKLHGKLGPVSRNSR